MNNSSSTRRTDYSRLVVRAVHGCTDSAAVTPNAPSGEPQEWAKDLIPFVIDPSQTPDMAQALATIPPYSELTVGRAPNCWLRLKDPSISGRHCRLCLVRTVVKSSREPCEGRTSSNISCYIIDQSTNGTFVDHAKLPKDVPTLLSPDQIVSLGRGRDGDIATTQHVFAFSVSIVFSSRPGVVELEEATSHEPPLSEPLDTSGVPRPPPFLSSAPTSRAHFTQLQEEAPPPPSSIVRAARRVDGFDDADHTDTTTHPTSSLRFVTPPPSSRRPPNLRQQQPQPQQQQQCTELPLRTCSGCTPSSRITDLVKRLQREGTKKDEEIAEMVGELERSEAQKQDLLMKLKAGTDEIDTLQRQLAAVRTDPGCHYQLKADALGQGGGAGCDGVDRWERKVQEIHSQTTVLSRRLESTQALLHKAQTARDEAVTQLRDARAQLSDTEIRRDQAIGLLKASREEAERLRAELETTTKSEQELLDRIRVLERRLAAAESRWIDAQSATDKQLTDLQEKAYNYLAEAESHARLIEAQKLISMHVNGLLRNAFALTAKAADPEGLRDLMARGAESELLECIDDIDAKSPDTQLFHEDTTASGGQVPIGDVGSGGCGKNDEDDDDDDGQRPTLVNAGPATTNGRGVCVDSRSTSLSNLF